MKGNIDKHDLIFIKYLIEVYHLQTTNRKQAIEITQ